MTSMPELQRVARIALRCLDLTSLNDDDGEAEVARLCARAQSRHGPVAAVCVWPRLAAFARAQLPSGIAVAAVANFPDGGTDVDAALCDVQQIVDAGAQEVDVVLPWRALLAGDEVKATALLRAVRRTSHGLRVKAILETGELRSEAMIQRAARLALHCGADFLKTSTGRTKVGATPQALRLMLQAIGDDAHSRNRVGVKASGGIRSVADAAEYIALCEQALGAPALQPQRFRIGASSLLDDIDVALGGMAAAAAVEGY
jgi:deoxyribose-phosphate aldolase